PWLCVVAYGGGVGGVGVLPVGVHVGAVGLGSFAGGNCGALDSGGYRCRGYCLPGWFVPRPVLYGELLCCPWPGCVPRRIPSWVVVFCGTGLNKRSPDQNGRAWFWGAEKSHVSEFSRFLCMLPASVWECTCAPCVRSL